MRLIDYWPIFLQKLREFIDLAEAEQPEVDLLWNNIRQSPDEFFLKAMTVYGIERWEKILGLVSFPHDTLEDRRYRIEVFLSQRLPYTYRQMIKQLVLLVGENGFRINLAHSLYHLEVWLELGVKSQFDSVYSMLRKMIPANLTISIKLLYNRHIDIKERHYTHEQLRVKKHIEIKEEVLI